MLTGGFLSMIKEYSISGMSCAACSASVERAVRRISGVDAASVNLSTEKLFVRSTNDLSDEIFAAVQKVGFGHCSGHFGEEAIRYRCRAASA